MKTKPKKKTRPALWTLTKGGIKPRTKPQTKKPYSKPRLKRVRPVSKRRQKLNQEYIQIKAKLFSPPFVPLCVCSAQRDPKTQNPICCPNLHIATEIHHSRGRVSTLLTDQRFFILLCSKAHDWVHANPDAARKLGLLCARGEWNKPLRKAAV